MHPGNRYAAFVRWSVGHGAQPHGRRPDGWALVCVRVLICNRRRTLLKVLAFDGDGYWIWAKRLEAGQFAAPGRSAAGKRAPDSMRCSSLLMTRTDLLALLEGIDFVVKKRRKRYKKAA